MSYRMKDNPSQEGLRRWSGCEERDLDTGEPNRLAELGTFGIRIQVTGTQGVGKTGSLAVLMLKNSSIALKCPKSPG